MDTQPVKTLASLCKALSDPIRLRVLALIADGEVCVCHIHESLDLPQPTVSRHLAYLRRAGLVTTRRDGLWIHYTLEQPHDRALQAVLTAAIHATGHAPSTQKDKLRLGKHVPRAGQGRTLLPVVQCCG